jgi:hypothetical protein
LSHYAPQLSHSSGHLQSAFVVAPQSGQGLIIVCQTPL